MALHSPGGIFDISSPWKAHRGADCRSRLECRGRCRRRTRALRHKIVIFVDDFKLSAQARRVALSGVFFPILTETPMGHLVVGMCPQSFDIDVDAQSWGRR